MMIVLVIGAALGLYVVAGKMHSATGSSSASPPAAGQQNNTAHDFAVGAAAIGQLAQTGASIYQQVRSTQSDGAPSSGGGVQTVADAEAAGQTSGLIGLDDTSAANTY